MRRSLAWAFALPLTIAGSQVAHALAYRWVYPSSELRLRALVSTGNGYLDWLPIVFAVAAALVLMSLVVAVLDVGRGRRVGALPAWSFALLPVVVFVVQEVLERSLHAGTFCWQAVEAPTFLPGLLLQLPFALAAYLVARLLLRTARAVAGLVRERRAGVRLRPVRARAGRPSAAPAPRRAPLSSAAAGRAPPLLASA